MKLTTLLLATLFAACSSTPTGNAATAGQDEAAQEQSVVEQQAPVGDITIEELDEKYADYAKAYFAGGCFWCTEAAFDRINGVIDVYSGYTGGPEKDPTYYQVASGSTGHAEAVVVYFDPEVVTYNTLLDVFFVAHDPTQVNRQGPDRGPQYRTEIFFLSPEQKTAAKEKIAALDKSGKFTRPIATKVTKAAKFYVAEGYHQDYYEDSSNPNQRYVQNVSKPKVEKVMKTFSDILKPEFRKVQ